MSKQLYVTINNHTISEQESLLFEFDKESKRHMTQIIKHYLMDSDPYVLPYSVN